MTNEKRLHSNELAHSQDSVISNLEWTDFVDVLDCVETFLLRSDKIVEELAAHGARDFEEYLTPSA